MFYIPVLKASTKLGGKAGGNLVHYVFFCLPNMYVSVHHWPHLKNPTFSVGLICIYCGITKVKRHSISKQWGMACGHGYSYRSEYTGPIYHSSQLYRT